jgi:puromycin-sensitive aminopeptidase
VAAVAARGGGSEYDAFVARIADAATPQETLRYTYALAEFRDRDAFARMLAHVDSGALRIQEQPFVFNRAIANREHGATAWAFVRDRWDAIAARVSPANLGRMVDSVRFLTTPELEAEVQAFFVDHDIPQARIQLRQTLERQRVMARFRRNATEDLAAYLRTR